MSNSADEIRRAKQEGKLTVVTSFLYPMYDFAVKVGGEKVRVVNLVPAGTAARLWFSAPADIASLEQAEVFVYNGAGNGTLGGGRWKAPENESLDGSGVEA